MKSQQHHQESQNILASLLKNIAEKDLGISVADLHAIIDRPEIDRMLGCLYGAFIADALGSFCQFKPAHKSVLLSAEAMTMPGGGPFRLLPGQVTDDSELALHMLAGLQSYNGKASLESQLGKVMVSIAKQYIQWWNNRPFDIGFTTRSAISKLLHHLSSKPEEHLTEEQEFKKLRSAFADIKQVNKASLSNGFLMRISPMVCFSTLIKLFKPQENYELLEKIIIGETYMTHTNQNCVKTNLEYISMLQSFITRKQFAQIPQFMKHLEEKNKNRPDTDVNGSAIQEAIRSHTRKDKHLMVADGKNAGFYKIAYFYTIYCLQEIATTCKSENDLNAQTYKKAIKLIIEQGGDTDTNACIVGAAIGSIIGFRKLPAEYLMKLLSLRLGDSKERKNEEFYSPANGLVGIIKLIEKFQ